MTSTTCTFVPRNAVSWLDLLDARAAATPEAPVLTELEREKSPARSYCFATLAARARAIAARLQAEDLVGQRALLLYPGGLDFVEAFLGCLYAGVVAVPTHIPMNERVLGRMMAIVQDCRAACILSTSRVSAALETLTSRVPGDCHVPRTISTDQVDTKLASEYRSADLTHDSLAFLQYTSGSTGDPKGVMLTHANLLHNSECLRTSFDLGPSDTSVSWLPVFHDMGLILGVLQPIYAGFHAYLMEPVDFLRKPVRWVQAISRHGATHAGGPNFAYALLTRKVTDEELATLDLSTWRTAFNGAEPVRIATLEAFSRKFAPTGFKPRQHLPCYGLAEGTLIASGTHPDKEPVTMRVDREALGEHRALPSDSETAVELVSSGRAAVDTEVRIVHATSGQTLADLHVGEIWVRSRSVAVGYWQRREASREVLEAVTMEGEGPFLRTGDLGFLRDGELFVTGRLKDVIIIRGRNHYPQDIEVVAEASHLALRPGCSAAFSSEEGGEERLVLVAEVERRREPRETPGNTEAMATRLDSFHPIADAPLMEEVASAIRRAVLDAYQLRVEHVVLLKATTIPKTSSGKIQRRQTRTAWQSAQLSTLFAD